MLGTAGGTPASQPWGNGAPSMGTGPGGGPPQCGCCTRIEMQQRAIPPPRGPPRHLHPGQAPGGSQPHWGAGWERCSLALQRGTGARVPGDRHRSPPKSGRAMGRAGRHVQGGRRVRGGMLVCFVSARTKLSSHLCTYRDMKNEGPHPACPLSHAAGASFEDFHC